MRGLVMIDVHGLLVPMATLEQRVEHVESQAQEDRHLTRGELAAHSEALSRAHRDILALRVEVQHGFADARTDLARVETEIKAVLAEVLRRLPPPPSE